MLTDLGAELHGLKDRKKQIEKEKKDIQSQIDALERRLREEMAMQGLSNFTDAEGRKFTPVSTLRASCPKENQEDLCRWLEANGCGDLVTSGVHHSRLQAWVKDRIEHDLPVPEYINTYDQQTIRVETK